MISQLRSATSLSQSHSIPSVGVTAAANCATNSSYTCRFSNFSSGVGPRAAMRSRGKFGLSYYREQWLPVVVLRLFSVYGERERPDKLFHKLISSILNDKPFPLHEGSEHHTRSYTAVQDIVDGCFRVIEYLDKCMGQIFNLGTDQVITTGEAIRLLETIIGKEAIIKAVPRRPGDQVETAANITKARAILGYDPVMKLADGLV